MGTLKLSYNLNNPKDPGHLKLRCLCDARQYKHFCCYSFQAMPQFVMLAWLFLPVYIAAGVS